MGRPVSKNVFVYRIYCEDIYFVYTMDVTGHDPEEALRNCEKILKADIRIRYILPASRKRSAPGGVILGESSGTWFR